MAESRKIQICIPEYMLEEIDSIVNAEKINRSEFVRHTIKLYIRQRRMGCMADRLEQGYRDMAEINKKLSQIWCDVDSELQLKYEEMLGELE